MKRLGLLLLAALVGVGFRPSPAEADATAFVGFSPTVASRSTTGFAVGLSVIFIGFEFEYCHINENTIKGAPGEGTGMVNISLQTPTKTQLYVTAGGGFYHETLVPDAHTNVGTNIGGGVKIPIAGPVRMRIDYRVLNLNDSFSPKHAQRIYFGFNFSF